jgi:rhodanese-related sulfurtransferase
MTSFIRFIGAIAIFFAVVADARAGGAKLSPETANKAVASGTLTLIDVRSPEEWRKTGIAKGATPITMHNPKGKNAFLQAVLAKVGGDLNKPIARLCAAGVRSSLTQRFLISQGFTNVSDVPVGMLGRRGEPGWIARGLPITPCPNC